MCVLETDEQLNSSHTDNTIDNLHKIIIPQHILTKIITRMENNKKRISNYIELKTQKPLAYLKALRYMDDEVDIFINEAPTGKY